MRWKTLACAGLLPATLGGCYTAHDLLHEHRAVHSEDAITRELHRDARCAWREVRGQFPRRMFSEEFRDGFLDGYTDYLDRGGNASPPLVPPVKYTRDKKYYTPEGQALLKDYFLGFKYGTDVAVATGCRQFLTVPVLLPNSPAEPPAFNVQPGGAMPVYVHPTATVITATPAVVAAEPQAAKPVSAPKPLPTPQPLPGGVPVPLPADLKFAPSSEPAREFTLPGDLEIPSRPTDTESSIPVPIPRIPVPPVPLSEAPRSADVIPASYSESKFVPAEPPPNYRLPEPPAEVPELPEHVPTPSILDELPVLKTPEK